MCPDVIQLTLPVLLSPSRLFLNPLLCFSLALSPVAVELLGMSAVLCEHFMG